MIPSYRYRARFRSAYDADSIRVDLDLGFGVWMENQALRLLGIDAPELRGEEREAGLKSRDALRELMSHAQDVVVETDRDKSGKYGRWLARVWIQVILDPVTPEGDADPERDAMVHWINVNAWLVDGGFAEAYGRDAPRWLAPEGDA